MEQIKKIDIHAHATPFAKYAPKNRVTKLPMPSPEGMISLYNKLGIEKGVLLPISAPEGQRLLMPTETCIYMAEQYPERFLWFCNVDPRAWKYSKDCELGNLLEHYISLGAKGLGELTANLYTDDPLVENLFGYCQELNLPVTIHIAPKIGNYYGIVDEVGLPRLEKILKKFPRLTILGHSQCFWSEIGENSDELRLIYPTGKATGGRVTELLRRYENLLCDISAGSGSNAFMRDREHTAKFVQEFSDRILYGCDICSENATFPFEFDAFLTSMRENGEISEINYRKIVRENAIKLLKL